MLYRSGLDYLRAWPIEMSWSRESSDSSKPESEWSLGTRSCWSYGAMSTSSTQGRHGSVSAGFDKSRPDQISQPKGCQANRRVPGHDERTTESNKIYSPNMGNATTTTSKEMPYAR